MAFEADCGVSTVLEALGVARTARPLSRRGPPQQRHTDWGLREGIQAGGRQIRNPKSEIRNLPRYASIE